MKKNTKEVKNICCKNIIFVIFITIYLFSCKSSYQKTSISGNKIPISDKITSNSSLDSIISPYKSEIDNDLNETISKINETLDKSKGKWQSKMGIFYADACLEMANVVFKKRYDKEIDLCIMNFGGIRSILQAGEINKRNAFEIMPFENSAVVCELKGEQIKEFVEIFIKEGKSHPISGISFSIKNNTGIDIKIGEKELNEQTVYYVLTNDYLSDGGDNMEFFKKNLKAYDLEYKTRNILIDYFIKHKEIIINDRVLVNDLDQNKNK